MEEITTTDLARFGSRELVELEFLLKAWREEGLPKDFEANEVTVMMNTNSGNVFFTNSEFQVAMLTNDSKLESFYSCPICGHEGFMEDMAHNEDDAECQEYLESIGRKL